MTILSPLVNKSDEAKKYFPSTAHHLSANQLLCLRKASCGNLVLKEYLHPPHDSIGAAAGVARGLLEKRL